MGLPTEPSWKPTSGSTCVHCGQNFTDVMKHYEHESKCDRQPTPKHREEAREIAKRYTREGTGYADRLYQLAYAIEQALSSRDREIREVLEGLAVSEFGGKYCWCPDPFVADEDTHDIHCLAARGLWERVQGEQK